MKSKFIIFIPKLEDVMQAEVTFESVRGGYIVRRGGKTPEVAAQRFESETGLSRSQFEVLINPAYKVQRRRRS